MTDLGILLCMCGRFSATSVNQIEKNFPYLRFANGLQPRYNVAPTQSVMMAKADGRSTVTQARWGLIPRWAKSIESQKIQPINAKVEAIAESPMFSPLLESNRCILLADGFYEWKTEGGKKTPYYFKLKSGDAFAFAGLWDSWNDLESCLLITGEPNKLVEPIHNRMPMMLDPDTALEWISDEKYPNHMILQLLKPYPAELMEAYAVSPAVNKVDNDSKDVVNPAWTR